MIEIIHSECLAALREISDASVDSVVTDPPYGFGFMGKHWDAETPSVDVFRECLRVLKPGGHLLAFGGPRTYHRLAAAVEDAGFEIRDQMMWLFGSGFPKSHNVSKAIDKMAGAEREVIGVDQSAAARACKNNFDQFSATNPSVKGINSREFAARAGQITAPATPDAQKWDGWGTALKPAHEPIVMARKPFKGTVAANVLEHGTGALNIDGCRVPSDSGWTRTSMDDMRGGKMHAAAGYGRIDNPQKSNDLGRWPANILHDGSEAVVGIFPVTSGDSAGRKPRSSDVVPGYDGGWGAQTFDAVRPDSGSAARYFYCAKASKRDRGDGNNHPTVKPTALMRYLVRLVTPPGGVVLDPFCGSGSTGKAAVLEGFRFIGIEREAEYVEIARMRCENAMEEAE